MIRGCGTILAIIFNNSITILVFNFSKLCTNYQVFWFEEILYVLENVLNVCNNYELGISSGIVLVPTSYSDGLLNSRSHILCSQYLSSEFLFRVLVEKFSEKVVCFLAKN